MAFPTKRRWLLLLIWSVVFINLAYFAFMQLDVKNKLVQKYVTTWLADAAGGEVEIGNLSFSDRFLLVENFRITLPNSNLEFSAESIHVVYKLRRLLWQHLSGQTLAEAIHINKSEIKYSYILDKKKKKQKKKQRNPLPDLSKYFKTLDVKNTSLEFALDVGAYKIKESFIDLDGRIDTETGVIASINGKTLNGGTADLDLDLTDGKFNLVEAQVRDYIPKWMWITHIDSLAAEYDINAVYKQGDVAVDAGMKNIYLEVAHRVITADSLDLVGNGDEMKIQFLNPVVDGNSAELQLSLFDVYSSNIAIDATLNATHTDISDYQPYVTGFADGQARMTGKLKDFTIEATAQSEILEFQGQRLENVSVGAEVTNDEVSFSVGNVEWASNHFNAEGNYNYDGFLSVYTQADTIRYKISNVELKGKLDASYHYKTGLISGLKVEDLSLSTPGFSIDNLELSAEYDDDEFKVAIDRFYDDLSFNGSYSLATGNFLADLNLRRFKISQNIGIFTFPNVSGQVKCAGTLDSLALTSSLRFYDQYFGNFDGRIKTNAVVDQKNNLVDIAIHTSNARYNYQPLQIDFEASGNLDSIQTSVFDINDELSLFGSFYRKPEFGWQLQASGSRLDIKEQLKYFVEVDALENYSGEIDFRIDADSRELGTMCADLRMHDLVISGLKKMNAELKLNGSSDYIEIEKGILFGADGEIGVISGDFALEPAFRSDVKVRFEELKLNEILEEKMTKGILHGWLALIKDDDGSRINLKLDAEKLKYQDLRIDSLSVDVVQRDSLLNFREFNALMPRRSLLEINGAIGYNLLSSNSFDSRDTLSVKFNGDIINILRQNIDYIKTGNSKCHFELECSMQEDGLDIASADIKLTGDDLRLDHQLEDIRDIKIDWRINNNIVTMRDLSARLGSGRLYVENSVGNNKEDLKFYKLNLGQILISTSKEGVRFHLPHFTPANSIVNIVLKGRDSHYFRLYMNEYTPLLIGNILINQAEVVYPPDSDNLSKLVNGFTSDIASRWTTKRKDENTQVVEVDDTAEIFIPYDLDLMIETGDNVRYVTYPFQVLFNPGSYASIRKNDEKFTFQDADLKAEEGNVELVGTSLDVSEIQITYSDKLNSVELEGAFTKKVADGTEITLLITDEGEGSFPNNLEISLESDNAYDLTDTEKLFRLRYGRGLDDITSEERNSLMQNDLIETAGGEIENIIIDPVINQFELFVSRSLNIDYFQMETSFIYNLLSGNSDLYGKTEDYNQKYSADILLENLSFKAGRYILNDLLLNYKITFQKVYDADLQTDFGVFHEISFRYDMPMDIKFLYEYNIDPWNQDSHEYKFTRTIRFSNIQDLYRKALLLE